MDSLKGILSQKKYFAPAWVFASVNIMTGTWVLYLPYVKTKFLLNDSQIGLALFCLALGLLISLPFIPLINAKIGLGKSTQWGIILYALVFMFPLAMPNYIALCISLLIVGWFSGFTDISMNAVVSTIEKNDGVHIMSSSHGFFSLGGFIGASIGSLVMPLFLNPFWHMLSMALVIIFSNVILSKHYRTIKEEQLAKEKHKAITFKNSRPLLGIAIVAFIIMFNEGAVEHWSNLFLFDVVKLSENKAGLGFIAFSLCMMIGRFFGDGISKRKGSIYILFLGCSIAIIGYLSILSVRFIWAIVGFGILGLGLSVIVPELFRLAGKTKGVKASVAISIVSGVGFSGFLLGPVILGFISNTSSLIWSYVFMACLVLIALSLIILVIKRNYSS